MYVLSPLNNGTALLNRKQLWCGITFTWGKINKLLFLIQEIRTNYL